LTQRETWGRGQGEKAEKTKKPFRERRNSYGDRRRGVFREEGKKGLFKEKNYPEGKGNISAARLARGRKKNAKFKVRRMILTSGGERRLRPEFGEKTDLSGSRQSPRRRVVGVLKTGFWYFVHPHFLAKKKGTRTRREKKEIPSGNTKKTNRHNRGDLSDEKRELERLSEH